MKIEKTIQEDRQAKLVVQYTQPEFDRFKRRAAKRISKNSKIPGFRPGKAPYNVIVNYYGKEAVIQEAIDILLDEDYVKMLDEAEIKPYDSGSLEGIENYDPPKLVFMIPLEPEIDLGDYREIRKPFELEEFDTTQVDAFIDKIRRNVATIVPSDYPAREEDLVYFNLSGEFLNPEEGVEAVITDKTPQQVVIAAEGEETEDEWPYPGFSRELIGVEAGDTLELQHQYPEDFDDEEFQGKTAVFTVEVQSVKELDLPELDQDFLQILGDYETPEELRNSVEEHLRTVHEELYTQEYIDDILEQITENTKISYPPQMLEHQQEHVLEDIKSRLKEQDMDYETYLELRGIDEETLIRDEIKPTAKLMLERSLVIDALIKAEGLMLDQELLKRNISDVVTELFDSGNPEEMEKQLVKDDFSNAISVESINRTMNAQIQERLKLIATGQPIPEESDIEAAESTEVIIDEAEEIDKDPENIDVEVSLEVSDETEEDESEEIAVVLEDEKERIYEDAGEVEEDVD
ncbi:MAG: trigger factor [Chloroflexota bacterium]|nr:trigger factor [Chloroflexota bacterium]